MNTIPLNASFVGPNTVLNDGRSPNTLVIRVSNLLPEGDIPMHANGKPARFVLTFSVSPNDNPEQNAPWALCTLDAIDELKVHETSRGWQRTRIQVGPFAAWEFTPPASEGEPVLAAGEHVQIEISEIICRLPSGSTTLALHLQHHNNDDSSKGRYETVARFLLTAEKSPLIYRDVYSNERFQSRTNLGIGTTIGNTEKQIRLAIGAESTGLHDPAPGQLALWTNGAERLRIDDKGRISIGTTIDDTEQQIRLAIGAESTGLHDPEQGQLALWAGGAEQLRIDDQGRVGIGTPTPGAKLEIAQGSGLAIKVEPDPNQIVYIGSSPLNALELNSNDGQALNSTAHLNFNIDTNQTDKDRHVSFQARGTTLMRIHQAGNVGIPLPDAKTRLTITGKTANADEAGLKVTNSDGKSLLLVRNDGNIGIGTPEPEEALQISDFNVSGSKYIKVAAEGGNKNRAGIKLMVYENNWGYTIEYDERNESNGLNILRHSRDEGTSALFIKREYGNIGIGTTDPKARLHVHTDIPTEVRKLSGDTYPHPPAIFTGCLNDSKAKELLADLPIYSFMFGVEAQAEDYNALLFWWKDGHGHIHKGYFQP